ncbi:MAG: RNA polymerase sigma factor, partial [Opitutaceae bacterium]
MMDDTDSLRRYAAHGSEDAFAALVQRYLPVVYASALRRMGGDIHGAQDVAQSVFVALARNARALATHPDLTGWLFTTTRFLAAKAIRSERRRQAREQEVFLAHDAMSTDSIETIAPLHAILDDVTLELRQLDRQVILLRFHRGLRLAEIGSQLGATETAVQKRLDRALDQLKEKLARRGITSTAAALALAFEQQAAAIAMPAGLAAAATTAGLAAGAGAGSLLAVSTLMTISKLQLGVAATVIAATSAGLVWHIRENAALRSEIAHHAETLQARTAELKQNRASQTQRASAAEADAASLQSAVQRATSARTNAMPSNPSFINDKEASAAHDRASNLAKAGKFEEALEAFLKLYRYFGANPRLNTLQQMVMTQIKDLGEKHPPALTALRDLRDTAIQKLRSGPPDGHGTGNLFREIGVLNERLGDTAASMRLFDTLPPGDPGRQSLASIAHSAFVEARRYADAMVGKSFGSMIREF